MSDDASVSNWLDGLRAGDAADVQRLWERSFEKPVRLTRTKLPARNRPEFNEEDVALSAFHSFCDRAGRGHFPQLQAGNDRWRLLSPLTARRVIATVRHRTDPKRGGGKVLGESAPMEGGDADDSDIVNLLGQAAAPEAAARFADDFDRHFGKRHHPVLKTIALRKLEGLASEAIGNGRGVSARTVDRELQLFRAHWEEERAG